MTEKREKVVTVVEFRSSVVINNILCRPIVKDRYKTYYYKIIFMTRQNVYLPTYNKILRKYGFHLKSLV